MSTECLHLVTRINRKFYVHLLVSKAVVVAQLVERSLPIPEVRGSNPIIGKDLY